MSDELKNQILQLLNGFQESLEAYTSLLSQLISSGKISAVEADTLLKEYHHSLLEKIPWIHRNDAQLQLDDSKRDALLKGLQIRSTQLDMNQNVQVENDDIDAIAVYLNHKRQKALDYLEQSMQTAQDLFKLAGPIHQPDDAFILINVVEQLNKETTSFKIPCWYWGKKPVHYDSALVDEIEKQTKCQATIFQRIPDGFVRISTNIRSSDGRRAVGTFITNETKVVKTILQGEIYRGSAFVLNNWYLSIYQPFYINGKIEGMLYVGRKETLELAPMRALSEEKAERIFKQLQTKGAFQMDVEEETPSKLIEALSDLSDHAMDPVINLGLKELSALLLKEKERSSARQIQDEIAPRLGVIMDFIENNISEELSVDVLAGQMYMSKASLYRYFKTKFNTTPKAFINQERLRRAYELMESDQKLTVQEICAQVGFKSTSHFIKLFKDYYGLTPKQFQMQREV